MAQDIFLKLPGIEGESTDRSHSNEIEVLTWTWSVSQQSNMHMGSGGGAGKCTVDDLTFEHYIEVYESVTEKQNSSLQWLIKELTETLHISSQEIYRHPQLSYETPTEAATAKW